ncbi:MAG TPA: FHA domain-containing serine/threonine-protein kinase [Gemmataceae bacterium]|nr:FHA domain-containing serine/threonine-protein kinase [Gemmataceae bacterium]
MTAPSPSAASRQVDGICDLFDADWRAGKRPRVEDYLGRVTPAERGALLQALLAVELEYRQRQGEQPTAEEYRARFPDDAAAVEAAFAQPVATQPVLGSTVAHQGEGPALMLTATDGPYKGQTFTLTGHQVFLVGRSKQAHLPITQDRYVSRNHFLVEVNPPHCRLTDLGSRTGTFVNGERVHDAELRAGDTIKVGHTTLMVSLPTAAPVETAPGDDSAVTLGPERDHSSHGLSATAGNVSAEGPDTIYSEPAPPPPPAASNPALAHSPGVLAMNALLNPQPAPSVPPTGLPTIPGYRIERELGRGGMGVVYLAVNERDNSNIALKTIIPAVAVGGTEVRRFLREMEILGRLVHKHIVRFREADQAGGLLYFAMEYVEGTDAKQMLKKHGPLPVKTAVGMVCQLLIALAYAHDPARKFVHRDIKPANLLVSTKEGAPAVKLADFGLARHYQASRMSGLTMKGDTGGTPAFMPPEQITQFREVSGLADQYSAAATLYNLLTGCFLYDDGTGATQTLTRVLQEDPVPIRDRRPDLPEELAKIIHKALAKDARDRFPDVSALRAALTPFAR